MDLDLPSIRLLNTVSWLPIRFLDSLTTPLAKYEASLYGPFDAVLHHIFPLADRFMTKPQGLLRTLQQPDASESGRVSIDSMGAPVLPRIRQLRESTPKQPDFLVVKAGPFYGKDVPVVLVEIKRHDTILSEDHNQMSEYMFRIWEKLKAIGAGPLFFQNFRGYLVERQTTYEWRLPDMNAQGLPYNYTWNHLYFTKEEFTVKIKERADIYRAVAPTASSLGNFPGY
ncbi:hypothetical protein H0H81_003593 [Sphagnurus paluster]|uniref:Uncharacterized protein n=1 Tax=Sphagnurus paluster TaxID=117069 RepID=A0A9P7FP06_9AGAR|nr:hypothetical protein H0H81_003593 [Sphagnurus paluster]